MTDLRQAAMLALGALESGPDVDPIFAGETITALKAALEQPEQEPTCPECKAAVLYECVACSSNNYPPKPEQEPVGEVLNERGEIDYISYVPPVGTRLYTTPTAQRPWVGLTDDQILEAAQIDGADTWLFATAYAIEAKLKERNT
jgi:hypothetical protein